MEAMRLGGRISAQFGGVHLRRAVVLFGQMKREGAIELYPRLWQ